jgi:LysR family transcriptional regulator, glycine cleavage system transcriptional activator
MSLLSRLPLHTLPTFRLAARRQNLRATAAELHLTHSAVSQQIALLEQQLGLPLFERRGRGIVLNAAGQAFLAALEPALDGIAQAALAARAAAALGQQQLRLSVLPSFAQRWLLPRMGRWRERHPGLPLEVHASHRVVDLAQDGFHAALRVGAGPWKGVVAERLAESPLIAVAAPGRGARLAALADPQALAAALAAEPLLGATRWWQRFLALGGEVMAGQSVAEFNDAGLMLQACEADLGIALARELLAADALQAGRLVRVAPWSLQTVEENTASTYWFVHRPELADWPPLVALRQWLHDEMALSRAALDGSISGAPARTGPSGPTESRSRAPSAG